MRSLSCMESYRLMEKLRRLFSIVWSYMGTISSLALMLGIIGMSMYHIFFSSHDEMRVRGFRGLFNTANHELPRGLEAIANGESDSYNGSHVRFEYNPEGQLQRVVHVDSMGGRSAFPGSRVAEQRMRYDEKGHLLEKSNQDAYGMPAADAQGVVSRQFAYNEKGRLTRVSFHDAQGKGIVPRMPGYAIKALSYDDKNRISEIKFLDAHGAAILNEIGEELVNFRYDESTGAQSRRNLVGGKLTENAYGVAIERISPSNGGKMRRKEWFDAKGLPTMHRVSSCSVIQEEWHEDARQMRRLHLDELGHIIENGRSPSVHLKRFDEDGNLEWECYNGVDGKPCLVDRLGYSERICIYDDDKNLQREYFWDELGQPADCFEHRYARNIDGTQLTSLHRDGSTSSIKLREAK